MRRWRANPHYVSFLDDLRGEKFRVHLLSLLNRGRELSEITLKAELENPGRAEGRRLYSD